MQQYQLDHTPRWSQDDKMFMVRVHTKKQAQKILDAMLAKYPGSADVLPKSVDELDWNDANDPEIGIVPTTEVPDAGNQESQFADGLGTDVVLLDGPVYPLKESVKPLGFNFERNFNGIPGAVRARGPRPCPCRPPRTERPRRPSCVRARRAGLLGRAGGQRHHRPGRQALRRVGLEGHGVRRRRVSLAVLAALARRPRSPCSRLAAAAVCVTAAPARVCVLC